MNFLFLMGATIGALVVFAIMPLVGVLHVFSRGDWQPIGTRNIVWALLMLVPLAWIVYFGLYFLFQRRPNFDD